MGVEGIAHYLHDHWILIPLGVFILVTIGFGFRADRGALLFKNRSDVSPDERRLYEYYRLLKCSVVALVLLNLMIKLIRGDFN